MKIFIGSSSRHVKIAKDIAILIGQNGHKPLLWTDLFEPGDITFEKILNLSNLVDGGIFILAPDDEISSNGNKEFIPRDNVLIEAGVLFGQLGKPHVALCKVGDTKLASDWDGLTYIKYEADNIYLVEKRVLQWLNNLSVSMENKTINDYFSEKMPDFEDLVLSANEEIMISSFFISISQVSKALNDAVQRGVKVRLLLADYWGDSLLAMASMLDGIGTNGERVKAKLKSTLLYFANHDFPNNLEVRTIDYVFPTRTTIIDPNLDHGNMYVHISSYINRIAPKTTFHLAKSEKWFNIFNQEFEQIWQHAKPLDIEKAKLLSY